MIILSSSYASTYAQVLDSLSRAGSETVDSLSRSDSLRPRSGETREGRTSDSLEKKTGEALEAEAEDFISMEIGELIVDQTQTKWGHDFYDAFYAVWRSPPDAIEYTIIVSEKPLPRMGTVIELNVNDYRVYTSFLQPRYELIEEAGVQAARAAYRFLANYRKMIQDLEGEDMSGSGIY